MNRRSPTFMKRGIPLHIPACPVSEGERGSALRERLSSISPGVVALLLALGAVALLVMGLRPVSNSGLASWGYIALGICHLAASVLCVLTWKQVRQDDYNYHISDLFRSEAVHMDEICAVVDTPGLLWKSSRIHFRRKTRFGWAVTFVPLPFRSQLVGNHGLSAKEGLFGRYWATRSRK